MVYQQKGGIWKNTEDEILKAAVMKYGLNQWARISSLLVRKSASQVKARWYEWLDPSIKKTEWSREEEERLLHLAKLMPTQWRTIAPLVGRTAAQCIEHYDKLLDAAQQQDESYDPRDDPRKLRPGEIDPNPETRPARPDPIDMDEDEKEMLQEARARLANTRGKKAKRKAREKQLEQSRRVAALQKRRELKAAGIAVSNRTKKKKKKRGIDYNDEIPFYMEVPAGFHEPEAHASGSDKQKFRPQLRSELEGKRRQEEEERLRKLDAKKQREKEANDLPEAVRKTNRLNDAQAVRNFSKLALPSPQITDTELEQLARMQKTGADADLLASSLDEGDAATSGLLSSYRATPAPTTGRLAGRTPVRTPARPDTVMQEAANILALSSGSAPLLGGENNQLKQVDFAGATPANVVAATPNRFATPMRQAGAVGATPVRDQLQINDSDESGAVYGGEVAERHRQAAESKRLAAALASLPAPKNKYNVVLPEMPAQLEESEMDVDEEEDRADIEARQRREDELVRQELFKQRSQVVQRGLPRTTMLSVPSVSSFSSSSTGDEIAKLVEEELAYILRHDGIHHPLPAHRKKLPAREAFAVIAQPQLDSALAAIEEEVREMRKREAAMPKEEEMEEKMLAAWDEVHGDHFVLMPPKEGEKGSGVHVRAASLGEKELAAAARYQHERLRDAVMKQAERATKLEKKIVRYNKGYQRRAEGMEKEIHQGRQDMDLASTELACFEDLSISEQHAVNRRLAMLHAEVEVQINREKELQTRYAAARTQLEA